jgi:holo-[acyl-carrier protein] synthase
LIHGIGIDIVKIERLRVSVENAGSRFLERVFTGREIMYCSNRRDPFPSFAARFAAKEALIKALSTETKIFLKDVEVVNDKSGRPLINTGGRLGEVFRENGISRAHLSISHEKDYAAACVVLEM